MTTAMHYIPGTGSLKSTSASSMISEEQCTTNLFPQCTHLRYIRKLSEAKFPVYLVSYDLTQQYYAMKVFPWEDDSPTPFFTTEIRFAQFSHPNIIQIVYYDFEQETSSLMQTTKVSYILMEYAKFGDFFDVLISYKVPFNDTLIRTYFHQLIGALEALHSQGAAHLDLKLENLLMMEDYTMKLTDFDLSYLPEDGKVRTRGTKNFRAPEMLAETCTNPQAADIYSAGIILFLLKTGGMVPYKEDELSKGIDMRELKQTNTKRFWEKQCEFLGVKSTFFSEDFKSLFMRMTKFDPEERPTIAQIKSSRWYNKEIYTQEELAEFMHGRFGLL